MGVFGTEDGPERDERLISYLNRVIRVFQDAQEENPHLCVIFQELEKNFQNGEGDGL